MKNPVLKSEDARKRVSDEQNRVYVEKLSRMIDCKTVWTRDGQNKAEFDRFYATLTELFPQIAAKAAISSPLLETSIAGATGILVSITASPDIGLEDIDLASSMIAEEAHPDANIIWGAAFDPSLEDEMRVTIIATGFESEKALPADDVLSFTADVQKPVTEVKDDEPIAEVAPVRKAANPVSEPSISDSDFTDIMSILKKSKGNPRRF
jgi:hypothetical protein